MRTLAAILLIVRVCSAEIVDRVAANIERQVITDSEVREEIRVAAFIEGVEPDFGRQNLRATLDRLIDRALMRGEIEFVRFQSATTAEAAPLLDQVKQRFEDGETYRAALRKYGVHEALVVDHLRWQLTMLRFIEFRFQPAVEVTSTLVRQEYRQQARVWKETHGTEAPPLEKIEDEIEKIVRQRLIDSALDRWLGEVRTQNTILYHEGYQ